MFGELIILLLKVIFSGEFSFVKMFLTKLLCYNDNYFKHSAFGNKMVLSARRGFLHAPVYFLVKQENLFQAYACLIKIKFYDNLRATRAERVGGSLRRGYQFRSGTYTRALTLVPEVYFYYFH